MNIKIPDDISTRLGRKSFLLCLIFVLSFCGLAIEGANPVYIGEEVQFTNTTEGPKGMAWDWDFGDGGKSAEKQPSHIYKKPGKYTATLTVDVPNVGKIISDKNVEIDVKAVIAVPAAQPVKVKVDEKVVFKNNTEGPEDNINWEWNFGDGTTKSEDFEPAHTYAKSGNFTVTLTIRLKDNDGNIIEGIDPISESLVITVEPNFAQPYITKIEAGKPGKDSTVLPVTVEINGTYSAITLSINKKEFNATHNTEKKHTFDVLIANLKPEATLFPSETDKNLVAKATVIPNAPDGFRHEKKTKEETLSFKVTPDRSGLFWILLGVILVLIGTVVGYILWLGKQPRVEGQLRDMDGNGRKRLFDYKKKRDLEMDLGDVGPRMAGQRIHFKFRGRKIDPDRQISVLTSDFQVNGRSHTAGTFCEVRTKVVIKIGDHKIEYNP